MRVLVLTGLIALSLAAPAAAQTGVVSGKVTDPQFDMVPQDVHSWNDLKSFEMTYDADRGVVRGELQTYGGVYPYPWFTFYADLGRTQPGGACDANADGSLLTSFYTPDDAPVPPDPPHAQVIGGPLINGSLSYVYGSGDFDTQIYTFSDPRLVGRTLNCVKNVALHSVYGTIDAGSSFCMGPTGQITCPVAPAPVPAPAAPTQLHAVLDAGTVHLAWDPSSDPGFSYFAVRRSTQPDVTQTELWTRLAPNFGTPEAADAPGAGTFYYYVTQINTDGAVSGRSNVVSVTVPQPAPSAAPAPPGSTPPGAVVPSAKPLVPQSSGTQSAADLVPPSLTLSGRTTQRIDRGGALAVNAACGTEPCTVTARGSISMPGAAAVYKLVSAKASLPAGGKAKLKLKVPHKALGAVRLALGSGHAVRARVTVTAVDAAGNRTTRTRTIRARR
jgi:hypothetical protein